MNQRSLNDLPFEILSQILEETARINEREGVTFTFGLSQAPQPLQRIPLQKYVRGPVCPDMLRWDATKVIRTICRKWHSWALQYAMRDVYIRRWRGSERWAELSYKRENYPIYELIDRPSGAAVYRDPYCSLRNTVTLLDHYPDVAANIRRFWFNGFYTTDTDNQIFDALKNCVNLTALSAPWTTVRHISAERWRKLLSGEHGQPLQSLELLSVDLTAKQTDDQVNRIDLKAFESPIVDFSHLKKLKIFGDTSFMPINDNDLYAIARTATRLEEFHLTCLSTISIDGVMAIVSASKKTLRVLEHSPRSNDGFFHPHPGSPSSNVHLCELLTDCPRLETVSLSMPSMCTALFSNKDVRWHGDFQVRALHLCGHEHGHSTQAAQDDLKQLLSTARGLIQHRNSGTLPQDLYIELFFAGYIFEPNCSLVHGDMQLAEVVSGGQWPGIKQQSRKGPYGSSGYYGKDDESEFEAVHEDEFFVGARRNWVSIRS